ncbi:MAG: PAS domain-containing sensor histidine kinase [Melioribacteraceae bacterium]|nr:PAS domain-containing sensor histidine kinase [Melioribacteraceae bacterium]
MRSTITEMEITNIKSKENYFEELPFTDPYIVISKCRSISYMNHSFKSKFSLKEDGQLEELNSIPEIFPIYEQFIVTNYNSFNFDVQVFVKENEEYEPFNVDFKKVTIGNTFYVISMFSSLKKRQNLEESINNLFNAIDSSSLNVIIINHEGKLSFISKTFEKVLNKKIEKVYNHSLSEVLSEYISEGDAKALDEAIGSGKDWSKLVKIPDSDNVLRFYELSLKSIYSTVKAQNNFLLAAYDITSHIDKNRLTKLAEARQRLILDNISDLLLIIRKEKNTLYFEGANDNFLRVFPYSVKLKKHALLKETIPIELRYSLLEILNNPKLKGSRFKFIEPRSGREYSGKISFAEDPYEDFTFYIITMNDVTEQKAMEQKLRLAFEKELQLNKLKSAFLANMSHEIRTPLNAVVGCIDLIDEEIDAKTDDYLSELSHYLKDGVKRLLALVDNIVEVSRLESGEREFDLFRLEFVANISTIYNEYKFIAEKKNITVTYEHPAEKIYVISNDLKLRKILTELLDNAIKYNKDGGAVRIRIQEEDDSCIISVTDNGIGINESKLSAILLPFRQEEDDGYSRRYEGAGLGLTIAHKLTSLMNGKFEIKSQVDYGTIVTLTFPIYHET